MDKNVCGVLTYSHAHYVYERNLTFDWSEFILRLLAPLEILTTLGSYSGFKNPQLYTQMVFCFH